MMLLTSLPAPTHPTQCAGSPLAIFTTLLVALVNSRLERQRQSEAASSPPDEEYDVVIVGGGTAGCVLAARLTEDPGCRVLLLERGGVETPEARVPGFTVANFRSGMLQNLQAVVEEQNCNNTGCALNVPHVLGGGSSVNGMMYIRGNPADYNRWADIVGDPKWNYTNVLPYFKRLEDNLNFANDTEYHSAGGPQKVSWQPYRHPVTQRLGSAYRRQGYPFLEDVNGGNGQLGFVVAQTTTAGGERWSTYRSYLEPVLQRNNLRIETFATARRILLEDSDLNSEERTAPRASGVLFQDAAGKLRTVRARKEVILTAGAIHSPQILMLSGIGPAQHIQELNITSVVDLPVGENLMDHPRCTGLVLKCQPPLCKTDWEHHVEDIKDYEQTRDGPLAQGFVQFTSFHKAEIDTDSAVEQPDYQLLYMGTTVPERGSQCAAGDSWRLNRLAVMPAVLHPVSRGRVSLNTSDPLQPPVVRMGYFDNSTDLKVMMAGLRFGLGLNLTGLGLKHEVHPEAAQGCGTLSDSDEYLECVARRSTATMWHWAGTCAMGSVTDSALRVRGVRNLRVADASAMPGLSSGNTNAPTIMLAERAADLVREDLTATGHRA